MISGTAGATPSTINSTQKGCADQKLAGLTFGTKNKTLKYDPDGSLTIYVQADPPAGDQRANWLPAPKQGDFSLYVRAYWPKVAVIDGSWTPPPVKRVGG